MELQSLKNRFGIIGNSPGLNHALSDSAMKKAPLPELLTAAKDILKP